MIEITKADRRAHLAHAIKVNKGTAEHADARAKQLNPSGDGSPRDNAIKAERDRCLDALATANEAIKSDSKALAALDGDKPAKPAKGEKPAKPAEEATS